MNIAYLVLTHNNPGLLQRLINKLDSPGNAFFIHVDKKSSIESFAHIKGDNVVFLDSERIKCAWADYSLVEATLELIKKARSSGRVFDYYILLSGSCYPIKSKSYIDAYLSQNGGREFLEAYPFPSIEYDKLEHRLDRFRLRANYPFRNFKLFIQDIVLRFTPKRDYRKKFPDIKFYTGSQWWALTHASITHIIDFVDKNNKFVKLFKSSSCPDESFFQTIIMNSPYQNMVSHKLTYTDWRDSAWSPRTLDNEYYAEFSKSIILDSINNNSPHAKQEVLFGRKFNENSLFLDQLDRLHSQAE